MIADTQLTHQILIYFLKCPFLITGSRGAREKILSVRNLFTSENSWNFHDHYLIANSYFS